ncbi:MAG: VWA domain-containing protein [Planctomycetes bacterium]|nr:VWA domain-containing protein [Planctomycetota bacterium]
MSGVSFDDLRWLNLLLLAAGIAAVGAYGVWQRRRAMRIFADPELLRLGSQDPAPLRLRATGESNSPSRKAAGEGTPGVLRQIVRLALVVCALVFLVAAAIGPRWGEAQQQVVRRGIDVMVLLDVSRSMLARDIAPNRLERAKLAIQDDLLPALGGDRIGLIAFAGVPVVKCPLTSDYGFVRLALEDINTGSSPRGGTLIGDALRKADEAFHDALDTYRLVLLITDGDDQDSYPLDAAKKLWDERKIPVVAIALGDEREGTRIPVPTERGEEYIKYKGEEVRSKADFESLREIAAASGLGVFLPVGTKNFDLGEIYRKSIVPLIEYRQRSESETIKQPARYYIFAYAALALLLIDSFLRDGPALATAAAWRRMGREAA